MGRDKVVTQHRAPLVSMETQKTCIQHLAKPCQADALGLDACRYLCIDLRKDVTQRQKGHDSMHMACAIKACIAAVNETGVHRSDALEIETGSSDTGVHR
jgi:hypothetical protein